MYQLTCAFSIIGACLTFFFAVFAVLRRAPTMGGKNKKWNLESSFGSIVNQCHYRSNLLLEELQMEWLQSRAEIFDHMNFSFFITFHIEKCINRFKIIGEFSLLLFLWVKSGEMTSMKICGHFTRDVYVTQWKKMSPYQIFLHRNENYNWVKSSKIDIGLIFDKNYLSKWTISLIWRQDSDLNENPTGFRRVFLIGT